MKSYLTKTLIIGGTDYIGLHLLQLLVAAGRHVTVMGGMSAPQYEIPAGVEYIVGDSGQYNLIKKSIIFTSRSCQVGLCFCTDTSFDNPLSVLLQNLPVTVRLLFEAAAKDLRKV